MDSRKSSWAWWLLGYALLALVTFAAYRWITNGPPDWVAALIRSGHRTRLATKREVTAKTKGTERAVEQDLTKVARLQDLKPGTQAGAIMRRFGGPNEWGSVRKLFRSNSYNMEISARINGHAGPLDFNRVTWFYAKEPPKAHAGRGLFLEFQDNTLVRVFEGSLDGIDAD